MRTRTNRRLALQLESLEGRKAPSAGVSSGLHHSDSHAQVEKQQDHSGSHAEVEKQKNHSDSHAEVEKHNKGVDDKPGHDFSDDKTHNRHGRG